MKIIENNLKEASASKWNPLAFPVGENILSIMNDACTIEACLWVYQYPENETKPFINFQVSEVDCANNGVEVTNIHHEDLFQIENFLEGNLDSFTDEEIELKLIHYSENWIKKIQEKIK